ncbi:MAG: nuclear transport factor 2 family protein [Gemmatimonadales bacterium]
MLVTSIDSLRAGIASFWANAGHNMQDAKWTWGEAYAERYGPNDGVLTAAWSIPHIAPTGRPHVLSGVWTAVFRRIDGRWMIIAEHLSMPPPGGRGGRAAPPPDSTLSCCLGSRAGLCP